MATESLKEKARDEYIRLTEKDCGCKFENLDPKQRSIAMAKFYVKEIHNPAKTAISEDDLLDGVVDGSNDLGCDFIYRDDGHNLIVQAKYRKNGNSETVEDISHFQLLLSRFRNHELKPNKYLRTALEDINWETDTFELVFITFGKIDGQARKVSGQISSYPKGVEGLAERCDWRYFDENDLNIELRSSRNLQRGISTKTIHLYPVGQKRVRGNSVIETKSGEYSSFTMALDARQLIKAYEELDKDALFSLNIRNFIGNSNTNTAIIKTADENADNFFLYNNGISCLAAKVVTKDECLDVTGLQVINGAQTVKALVNLANSRRRSEEILWADGTPNVLVRITEVPDTYGAGGKIREKITQYNNTQNTIKISDFRSNDDVQKGLKDQFSEITRYGKRVLYLAKRTDKTVANSEVIRLDEFAKSVYSFLYDPTAFSGSTSFLFNLESNGGYSKVFGDGSKPWTRMPEDEFRLRAGIYWLSQEFTPHLRKVRLIEDEPDAKASLERKWMLLCATREVFQELYKGDTWKNQIRKLYKGDWRITDERKGVVLSKIFDVAKTGVILAYRNSKRGNPSFVHRNWMRGKQTPDEIAEAIRLLHSLMAGIGDIPS